MGTPVIDSNQIEYFSVGSYSLYLILLEKCYFLAQSLQYLSAFSKGSVRTKGES